MRTPCVACRAGCTIPDEGFVVDGMVLHRWCASSTAIAIIRALRRELGLPRKPRRAKA